MHPPTPLDRPARHTCAHVHARTHTHTPVFHPHLETSRALLSQPDVSGPLWLTAIPHTFRAVLVESIPEGLEFPNATTSNPSTSQAWLGLLAGAHSSLDIASFYWTLTNNDTHTQEPSAQQVPGCLPSHPSPHPPPRLWQW